MRKLIFTSVISVAIVAVILVFFMLFFYRDPIDEKQAKIIAESAFISLVKHLKMMPNQFEILPMNPQSSAQKVVVFVWQSKAKTECRIEVDVDMIYANARPTWICN